MKEEILYLQSWLINRIMLNPNSSVSEKITNSYYKELKGLIQWDKLTIKDARLLGFKKLTNDEMVDENIQNEKENFEQGKITQKEYDERIRRENRTRELFCIPFYLKPVIPKGIELVGIDGDIVINNEDTCIDDDTRLGCIAYGIILHK